MHSYPALMFLHPYLQPNLSHSVFRLSSVKPIKDALFVHILISIPNYAKLIFEIKSHIIFLYEIVTFPIFPSLCTRLKTIVFATNTGKQPAPKHIHRHNRIYEQLYCFIISYPIIHKRTKTNTLATVQTGHHIIIWRPPLKYLAAAR